MLSLAILIATVLANVAGTTSAQAQVQALNFIGIPSSGRYQKVTKVGSDGACPKQPYAFSGASAPLDEEISAVFRGPIRLKQFAVYTETSSPNRKRHRRTDNRSPHHNHQRYHDREQVEGIEEDRERRGYGDIVTATIDGHVVTFPNTWSAPESTPAVAAPVAVPAVGSVPSGDSPADPPSAAPAVYAGNGNWGRTAYYDATSATAEGLSFLGNVLAVLGAKLGYVTPNGLNSSTGPAILEDCLVPDNNEFVISSSTPCNDGDCGAVAPGANAHHGFSGASKMFLAEFQMPLSGQTGYLNADMPAFWMLNTQIVNTGQYSNCSCWKTGCGEWDIHEVLEQGATTGYATMHMGQNFNGQAPNGFARPISTTMKVGVIISNGVFHIEILDDSTTFGSTFLGSTVNGWINSAHVVNFPVIVGGD